MGDRQPLRGKAGVLDQRPAAFPVAPEPEEAAAVLRVAGQRAPGEGSMAITVVDVRPPTLEGRHQVGVAVLIQIHDEEVSTRERRSWSGLGKRPMKTPISVSVAEEDLDSGPLEADQHEVQKTV